MYPFHFNFKTFERDIDKRCLAAEEQNRDDTGRYLSIGTDILCKLCRHSSSDSEIINNFSCSIQLSMKFFLLLNVKMPTIANNSWHFNIYEQEK